VRLQPVDSREGSDYINANFILDRKYISCQAPIFSTFADHWRMIWETSCLIVVMLTKLFEGGRTKAHIYWPIYQGVTLVMGDISITKLDEMDYGHFVVRRFRLSKGGQVREIRHLHFTEWPDFGVPHSTKGILDLVDCVNNLQKKLGDENSGGPIVVHCSAGVGRSASFIAIHYALSLFENFSGDKLASLGPFVAQVVLQMRADRVGMVQTDKQFAFIHQVLSDFLTQSSSSSSSRSLSTSLEGMPSLRRSPPQDFHPWRNISSDCISVLSTTVS